MSWDDILSKMGLDSKDMEQTQTHTYTDRFFVTLGASHSAFMPQLPLQEFLRAISRGQVVASDSGRIVILEYDGTKNMPLS